MGDCVRNPRFLANVFGGYLCTSFSSSNTSPLIGVMSLDIVFRRVDFPQAFAPMITVILFFGISRFIFFNIIFLSYPDTIFWTFKLFFILLLRSNCDASTLFLIHFH